MHLEHSDLTESIIGGAIEVHKHLGPGFLESIYENALAVELSHRRIAFQQQLPVQIRYGDVIVGEHKLDLFVERLIVVELKCIRDFEDIHFAIVRSYLRAVACEHGLLLNFAKTKLDVRRVSSRPS